MPARGSAELVDELKGRQLRVGVVGAGIAGLASTLALRQNGIEVILLEAAPALREAGTALSLWPNSIAALDQLGLKERVMSFGRQEASLVIRRADGSNLLTLSPDVLTSYLGSAALVVRRQDLLSALLESVGGQEIVTSTMCTRLELCGTGVRIFGAEGHCFEVDAVIACDGLRSKMRRYVDAHLDVRRAHRSSWRAIVPSEALPSSMAVRNAWLSIGFGCQFVVSPLTDGDIYWSAIFPARPGPATAAGQRVSPRFLDWHSPIPELIEATDPAAIVTTGLVDSKPTAIVKGRVALAGDSAHPMTPDIGQGACQAIEDAAVLKVAFSLAEDVQDALRIYSRIRLRRVRRVAATSRRMARVFSVEGSLTPHVRDTFFRVVPAAFQAQLISPYASEGAFRKSVSLRARDRLFRKELV